MINDRPRVLEDAGKAILKGLGLPGVLYIKHTAHSAHVIVQYISDPEGAQGWTLEGLRERGMIRETEISMQQVEFTSKGSAQHALYKLIHDWLHTAFAEGETKHLDPAAFALAFSIRSKADG